MVVSIGFGGGSPGIALRRPLSTQLHDGLDLIVA